MPPEKCYEGKSDVFQFKDCISGCDPKDPENGDGCNSDLKAKFQSRKNSKIKLFNIWY